MKFFFWIVVGGLWPLMTCAQAPLPQWSKAFGSRISPAYPVSVVHISHGRTVAVSSGDVQRAGTVFVNSSVALWVIGPLGDSLRFMTLPRPIGHTLRPFNVAELPNGDFLVNGRGVNAAAFGTVPDYTLTTAYHFLTRIDSLGNVRWQRTFNNGTAWEASPNAPPLLLPDGGALVLFAINPPPGNSNLPADRPMLLRVDSTGATVWQRLYGNYQNSFGSIRPLTDGSYALAGGAFRPAAPGSPYVIPDAWIMRVTLNGDTLRSRYLGVAADWESVSTMQPTADGGLLLAGSRTPQVNQPPAQRSRGWLVQLDSLDRVQWQVDLQSVAAQNALLLGAEPLQGGDILLTGAYDPVGTHRFESYLARWRPGAAGPPFTTIWERYHNSYVGSQYLSPDGRFTTGGGNYRPTAPFYGAGLTRYANAGLPYVPAYCARPPVANAGYARPTPDSLRLVDFSQPGPRYGQLLVWRWALGDGTVLTRHAGTPVRHRYATVPAPGTAVTLTVTNNLGCATTQTMYPFGLPTASQQARALAAGAALFPNPATTSATLAVPGLRAQPPAPGEVADALGRVVRRFVAPVRAGTATAALDLAGLPPGVYAVRLRPVEGVVVKRLVRE